MDATDTRYDGRTKSASIAELIHHERWPGGAADSDTSRQRTLRSVHTTETRRQSYGRQLEYDHIPDRKMMVDGRKS